MGPRRAQRTNYHQKYSISYNRLSFALKTILIFCAVFEINLGGTLSSYDVGPYLRSVPSAKPPEPLTLIAGTEFKILFYETQLSINFSLGASHINLHSYANSAENIYEYFSPNKKNLRKFSK